MPEQIQPPPKPADRFDEMAGKLMEKWYARGGTCYEPNEEEIVSALRRVADEENEACAAIADPQSEKISYETCNAFTCLSAAAGMIRKRREEFGK